MKEILHNSNYMSSLENLSSAKTSPLGCEYLMVLAVGVQKALITQDEAALEYTSCITT